MATPPPSSPATPVAGPWKSKEKQSRLIHTAPVHQPSSEPLSSSTAPGSTATGGGQPWVDSDGSSRGDVTEQLGRLEAAYDEAKDR